MKYTIKCQPLRRGVYAPDFLSTSVNMRRLQRRLQDVIFYHIHDWGLFWTQGHMNL